MMMFNSFFSKFDKKRFLLVTKLIFVFFAIIGIINIVGRTYSRYESNIDLTAGANIAFFVVNQGTYESSISLTGLTPSNNPTYYTFYVANYDDENKRADVDLKYTIAFETTTNLPLQYEIIRRGIYINNITAIVFIQFVLIIWSVQMNYCIL